MARTRRLRAGPSPPRPLVLTDMTAIGEYAREFSRRRLCPCARFGFCKCLLDHVPQLLSRSRGGSLIDGFPPRIPDLVTCSFRLLMRFMDCLLRCTVPLLKATAQ